MLLSFCLNLRFHLPDIYLQPAPLLVPTVSGGKNPPCRFKMDPAILHLRLKGLFGKSQDDGIASGVRGSSVRT
jgi:hypothetical protein